MKINVRVGHLKIAGNGQLSFYPSAQAKHGGAAIDNDYVSVSTVNSRIRQLKNKLIRDNFDQATASTSGRSLSLSKGSHT